MSGENEADIVSEADTSTTGFTMYTPLSEETRVVDEPPRGAIPSPGNTYMILERGSGRAITLAENGLRVQDIEPGQEGRTRWHCIENRGYFGFYNPDSGKYIGHNGFNEVVASAWKHDGWECITPRMHPGGGYQILMPFWFNTLMTVVVAEDGRRLVKRPHGTTSWDFVLIQGR